MKKDREAIKVVLLVIRELCDGAENLPGNFISVAPDGKLAPVPFGSENLSRVFELILDQAEKLYGHISNYENAEILKLRSNSEAELKRYWLLRDRLQRAQEFLDE